MVIIEHSKEIIMPPAVQKAVVFIRDRVERGDFPPGSRLPAIAKLASMAGVSLVTMWKATKELRDLGILSGYHGQVLTVAGNFSVASHWSNQESESRLNDSSNALQKSWQRIKANLEMDILNNVYSSGGPLPSFKELQVRYNTTYRTLKKALSRLLEEQLVEPYKKGFAVSLPSAGKSSGEIVFITWGKVPGFLDIGSMDDFLLHSLESQSRNMGMNFRILIFSLIDDTPVFTNPGSERPVDLEDTEDIYGYIYLVNQEVAVNEHIFKWFFHTNKPISLINEIGDWQLPSGIAGKPLVRQFTMTASAQPVREVARYLLGKGHKTIAYFSPFHGGTWSRLRLKTLSDTYTAAG
ncbi:MAG: GntR family transcriptional regulator, partial [Chitinivibrionales bacterium]|nr:GntR family transcriptional regulator [Chitinivibrionales bacterium]